MRAFLYLWYVIIYVGLIGVIGLNIKAFILKDEELAPHKKQVLIVDALVLITIFAICTQR